jgi:hypothetical protein
MKMEKQLARQKESNENALKKIGRLRNYFRGAGERDTAI